MKTKPITFLVSITFLFLFSGSVSGEDLEVKRKYWDNGKLKREAHFKNNQLEGPGTSWYESGAKKGEYLYKNGKLEGLATEWYESGAKKMEGIQSARIPRTKIG